MKRAAFRLLALAGLLLQAGPALAQPGRGLVVATNVIDRIGTLDVFRIRVEASADKTNGPAPLTVAFTARGSPASAPYSTAAKYHWDFGDGGTAEVANPRHTYAAPGTYTGRVTYTRYINLIDPPEKTEQATQALVITVTPAPQPGRLVLTPDPVEFKREDENADPPPIQIRIANIGGRSVTWWAAVSGSPWLKLSASNGTVNPGQHAELQASAFTTGLQPGVRETKIVFRSREAGLTELPVRLVVPEPRPPANLAVDRLQIELDENGRAETVKVGNTGGRPLRWRARVEPESWVSVAPLLGSLRAGESAQVRLSATSAGLAPGHYTARIDIGSAEAANSPVSISVALNVASPVPGNAAGTPPGPPDSPRFPWPLVLAALAVAAAAGAALWKTWPKPQKAVAFEVRPILNPGTQRLRAGPNVVVPLPRLRFFCDPLNSRIAAAGSGLIHRR